MNEAKAQWFISGVMERENGRTGPTAEVLGKMRNPGHGPGFQEKFGKDQFFARRLSVWAPLCRTRTV